MGTKDNTGETGTPTEDSVELQYDLGERWVRFDLDEDIYPLGAIYGAAYIFIDKCYVFLTRPATQRVGVQLKTKAATADTAQLEELAGEFANELLNQLLRIQIGESTADIRKYYMARAFFGLTGNPSIDALLMELDDEELEYKEEEIALPWEERYKEEAPPKPEGDNE